MNAAENRNIEDKKQRHEAVMIFAGFSILMYSAAAYEFFIGFARGRQGTSAAILNSMRIILGEYALFICFFCMGTLFIWLAFVNRR